MERYRRSRVVLAALLGAVLSSAFSAHGRADPPGYDSLIQPEQRRHWSFQPVHRPAIPAVKDTAWIRNPIDSFVLAKLEARGWRPSAPATPAALLRRLYLDVVGVPPTPTELASFLREPTAAAWERTVSELLARPGYGERWARHWLDLARYADTNGYERDDVKPLVWQYRDYVIHSLNDDKPFDRFVLEQLAGDELPNADAETLVATGYYRLGPWDDEPADPQEDRFDQLDDMVSTTAQVYLGLTLGCARCHNHKFDPLTMLDYYRMVAIFNPLQRPQQGRAELPLPAIPPKEREAAQRKTIARYLTGLNQPLPALSAWVFARPTSAKRTIPHGYFLYESPSAAPVTHLLLRGKASRPGAEVDPGMPAVLVSTQPRFPHPNGVTSQRRLTLAHWIARADNPLTARVIVNRIWQFHFGEGLVRTPSDFGVMGDRPTHPELLDWLADWFVREGWSLKKLHRLILTSNTYRMNKRWNPQYGSEDPENRLLWRMPYQRLDVEAIRDSMLAATGQLDRRMYGPSMYPEMPKEALASHSDPDKVWKPFDEREASRRTIYAFVKRSLVVPMLEVMDLCDTTRTSARRAVTTVAPQALTLFNGDFVNRQADHLAKRLQREAGSDPARQIELAYLLTLSRPPTAAEQAETLTFLRQNPGPQALRQLCRVLFNLNEFVYPD
jgi:Protein of unknown function (DUF1553)/Protein of unknown function (DUF1549)